MARRRGIYDVLLDNIGNPLEMNVDQAELSLQ